MLRDIHHGCRTIKVGTNLAQFVETLDVVSLDVFDTFDDVRERCAMRGKGEFHLPAEAADLVE